MEHDGRKQNLKISLTKHSPMYFNWNTSVIKGKGKAVPLQAWTGPWGSRRLRLQNF
jgi:hypothetical protein